MNEKILSICIPNFNQGDALLRNIENLRNCETFSEIEIIISDNGSTDIDSFVAIERIRTHIPTAKILLGEAGQKVDGVWFSGFGANMSRLIENAAGRYIWFIGSGDLIQINYLSSLIEKLKSNKFDNLVLHSITYNNSSDINIAKWNSPISDNAHIEFLADDMRFDHSISCNITKSTILRNNEDTLFFQDSWPHVERYITYIAREKKFISGFVSNPILLIDQPDSGWFSKPDSLEIYFKLGSLYQHYSKQNPYIYQEFENELFKNKILDVVSLIIHLRLLSSSNINDPEGVLTRNLGTFSFYKRGYLYLSMSLPKISLKVLRKINSFALKIQNSK